MIQCLTRQVMQDNMLLIKEINMQRGHNKAAKRVLEAQVTMCIFRNHVSCTLTFLVYRNSRVTTPSNEGGRAEGLILYAHICSNSLYALIFCGTNYSFDFTA